MPFIRRTSPRQQIPEPQPESERGTFDWMKDDLLDLGEGAVKTGVEGLDWLTDPTSTRAKIGESAISTISNLLSPVGKLLGRGATAIDERVDLPESVKSAASAAGSWATTPVEPLKRVVQGFTRAITPEAAGHPALSAFTSGAGEAASEMTTPLDVAGIALPGAIGAVRGAVRGGRGTLSAAQRVMGTLGRQADEAARLRNTADVIANTGQVLGKLDNPLSRPRLSIEIPYNPRTNFSAAENFPHTSFSRAKVDDVSGVPYMGTPADASGRVQRIIGRENKAATGELMRDQRNLARVTRARGTESDIDPANIGGRLGGEAPDLNQVLIDALNDVRGPGVGQIDDLLPARGIKTAEARAVDEAKPRFSPSEEEGAQKLEDLLDATRGEDRPNDILGLSQGGPASPEGYVEGTPARRVMNTLFGLYEHPGTGQAHILRPGERTIDLVDEYAKRELGPGFTVTGLNRQIMPSGKDELARAIRQRGHVDEAKAKELGINFRDESGSIDPRLLRTLAGTAGGGLLGGAVDPENDPVRGGIVGALLGGTLGSGGVRGLLRGRRGAMLSGMALPKSLAGNVVAPLGEAAERGLSGDPAMAARIVKEMFRLPTNVKEFGKAFTGEARLMGGNAAGAMNQPGGGPLSIIGRLMGSADLSTREALKRAGLTADEAADAVLVNTPRTKSGQWYVTGPGEGRGHDIFNEALPFRKTATNVVERGLERTPVVGEFFRSGRAPWNRRLAQQAMGGGSMALGAGSDDINELSPAERGLLIAAMGRYAVPFALGTGAMRPLMETMPETDPVRGLQASKSAAENAKYLLQRYLKSFVPPDLR